MKYGSEIENINDDTSHGKILKQINPGSTVLECGCATGYMTRYMREQLGCNVYIVEFEQDAFDIAKQYAVDGICTDLMKDEWIEKFKGIKFDYILFADVLEHLFNPDLVLENAKKLLKDSGVILVSLPNIGHNDILINLFYNNWNYTSLGLLDDTHIRFWGENNLIPFFANLGLEITNLEYTYCPTLNTEQKNSGQIDQTLLQIMKNRNGGDVYQFIITAKINERIDKNSIGKNESLQINDKKFIVVISNNKLIKLIEYIKHNKVLYKYAYRIKQIFEKVEL